VDCIAIISSSHVIILDTFSTPEEAFEMMKILQPSLVHRQLLVINSHQHYDHVWGNSVFSAPILAHEDSKQHLEVLAADLLERQAEDLRFATVKIVAPNIYFSTHCTIHATNLTLELIPAFGHTNDQIVVWIPEISTLLATDALEFPFPYVAESGSYGALLETMKYLQTLKPDVIVPCHGGVHDASLINLNLEYFTKLEAQVKASGLTEANPDIGFSYPEALTLCNLETADRIYEQFHVQNIQSVRRHLLK
jgi:glyoxylase-like metal-dependent hydrolase (beta-lactamase superfamily II)